MLYGIVAYTLKDGRKANVGYPFLVVILLSMMGRFILVRVSRRGADDEQVEWAARANLTQGSLGGPWKLGFYQVYLVSLTSFGV
jgi:hypothetical protein